MSTPLEDASRLPHLTSPAYTYREDCLDPNPASTERRATYSLYRPWQRWSSLAILFAVTTSSYFDFYVLSIVLEPIRREFGVSDTLLGLLSGFCFAAIYAVAGVPVARWADRGNRRTIITLSVLGWSVITALCGRVQSFWQLVLARFCLGVVEPGAMPPAQSLIADYFAPEQRARAVAILNAGSSTGWFLAVVVGGYIAATMDWRCVFLIAGLPGILIAFLVRFTLPEPRCQLGFPQGNSTAESIGQAFSRLRKKRCFVGMLMGIAIFAIFAFGVAVFLPSYMMRVLHASLLQVSSTWGFAIALANFVGAVIGGALADRLSLRDIRWYSWLPAAGCTLGGVLYWIALTTTRLWSFIVIDFLAEGVLAMALPAAFAAVHAVCGTMRRATAMALVFFALTFFGAGFGPLVAGALSDAFSVVYGPESLRYSLLAMLLFLIPAAAVFLWSGRSIRNDLER